MKLTDLLDTVRPTGLVPPDILLDAIKEQSEKRSMDLSYRGFLGELSIFLLSRRMSVSPGGF